LNHENVRMLHRLIAILNASKRKKHYEEFNFGHPPPTAKQFDYASSLGIEISDGMTKYSISEDIGNVRLERALGLITKRKVTSEELSKIRNITPSLRESFEERYLHWQEIAKSEYGLALVIYVCGCEVNVEVVQIKDVSITREGDNRIMVKLKRPSRGWDYCLGEHITWDRTRIIRESSIIYHENLEARPEYATLFCYRKLVKRGLRILKQMIKTQMVVFT